MVVVSYEIEASSMVGSQGAWGCLSHLSLDPARPSTAVVTVDRGERRERSGQQKAIGVKGHIIRLLKRQPSTSSQNHRQTPILQERKSPTISHPGNPHSWQGNHLSSKNPNPARPRNPLSQNKEYGHSKKTPPRRPPKKAPPDKKNAPKTPGKFFNFPIFPPFARFPTDRRRHRSKRMWV